MAGAGSDLAQFACYFNWLCLLYTVLVEVFLVATKDIEWNDWRVLKGVVAMAGILNLTYIIKDHAESLSSYTEMCVGVLASAGFLCGATTYVRHIRGKEPMQVDMTGKVAIVTGSNTGIGYEVVKSLVRSGAHVIMACRSKEKTTEAIQLITAELDHEDAQIKKRDNTLVSKRGKITFIQCDLSDYSTVHEFATKFKELDTKVLDLLILNAGVMMGKREVNAYGHEMTMAVNHLGHFLLTKLLLGLLEKSQDPRVVIVASQLHKIPKRIEFEDLMAEHGYNVFTQYAQSKLANVMFGLELQRRLLDKDPKTKVLVNMVNPGNVLTDISRNMSWSMRLANQAILPVLALLQKMPAHGAYTILHVGCSPHMRVESDEPMMGQYFANCRLEKYSPYASDPQVCHQLWVMSDKLTEGSKDGLTKIKNKKTK